LAAGETGGDTRFRTNLQGLRAIAVILIVLYLGMPFVWALTSRLDAALNP
jgi:hypothetical protein